MRIKKTLLTILFCPVLIQAQISSKVIKQFPAHIIYKIDEVVSKVNVAEDKQIKIGQKLITADSLATMALANGESVEKLKLYYTINIPFLKSILSEKELDHYGYELNKDNRFLTALKFATELKLTSTQVSQIREQNDSLVSVPTVPSKGTIQAYNIKLSKILAKEQYISLLNIIYKDQSIEEAKKEMVKILRLKILSEKDYKTEFLKILNYYLAKNSLLDKKADKYDKKKGDFLAKKIALGEPPLLVRANILSNGSYKNNRYASVIKYEKELELTKNQIDSLLSQYRQHEKIKLENSEKESNLSPSKIVPSEHEVIGRILNPEQINKWLVSKNKEDARKEALRNWLQLEAEGLTKDLDKNKTLTEFANYQLKYLVIKEKAYVYHTPENVFMRGDVERKKPELLKQLDVITRTKAKNTTVKNALTW
ncbi:hypothetical protein B6A10_01520 [Flavobacterium sp. L1I52]|uniref:Uncharacterized protein n=1 Tax=Flavobacterium pokkalii TaxID=1940408 RepID=A0ABR7UMS8_9FLAO|nr:hypothetical protein [Flavobacterium pokkalii]MBD0723852.1 hypothetical protein [Flavobacterium pokkalii]